MKKREDKFISSHVHDITRSLLFIKRSITWRYSMNYFSIY